MNPPPIQWLPVFAKAAEYKSFKKAAEHLNVSPPAVSQQIKALEDYLGVSLFKRNGPRLDLSEAGEFYFESVQHTINTYRSGFEEFDRRFNKRTLRLNTPLFIAQEILIPNYLAYKKLEPCAELRITTGTEYIDFDENISDAAIRFGTGNWPALHSKLLKKIEVSPVCSPSYFEKNLSGNKAFSDCINEQVLLSTTEEIDEWRALYPEVDAREIIVCDSYFSVIKSAEIGLGVALGLFPAINSWVNNKNLKLITRDFVDTKAGYWFVYPRQRNQNDLLDSCYDWSKGLFESLPALSD